VLIRAARDAGLRLYVTDGVVEEVERHINRSLSCARTATREWRTGVPFLYSAYVLSGRGRGTFVQWAENFRGPERPEDDVGEYLSEVHGIERRNVMDEAESAPAALRGAVQEVWFQAHERRRGTPGEEELDEATRRRLVAHDVENTVGVIQLRRQAASGPLGYHAWWLTLDSIALKVLPTELKSRLGDNAPPAAIMRPDLMSQYLRLGPRRSAIERERWAGLQLITDFSRYEYFPKDLIDQADQLRAGLAGLDERIVRRRVRDQLDKAKLRR